VSVVLGVVTVVGVVVLAAVVDGAVLDDPQPAVVNTTAARASAASCMCNIAMPP
jgi:hypothetical protein